eukprot:PhF_6_TR24787/c0_g1_i1/m.34070
MNDREWKRCLWRAFEAHAVRTTTGFNVQTRKVDQTGFRDALVYLDEEEGVQVVAVDPQTLFNILRDGGEPYLTWTQFAALQGYAQLKKGSGKISISNSDNSSLPVARNAGASRSLNQSPSPPPTMNISIPAPQGGTNVMNPVARPPNLIPASATVSPANPLAQNPSTFVLATNENTFTSHVPPGGIRNVSGSQQLQPPLPPQPQQNSVLRPFVPPPPNSMNNNRLDLTSPPPVPSGAVPVPSPMKNTEVSPRRYPMNIISVSPAPSEGSVSWEEVLRRQDALLVVQKEQSESLRQEQMALLEVMKTSTTHVDLENAHDQWKARQQLIQVQQEEIERLKSSLSNLKQEAVSAGVENLPSASPWRYDAVIEVKASPERPPPGNMPPYATMTSTSTTSVLTSKAPGNNNNSVINSKPSLGVGGPGGSAGKRTGANNSIVVLSSPTVPQGTHVHNSNSNTHVTFENAMPNSPHRQTQTGMNNTSLESSRNNHYVPVYGTATISTIEEFPLDPTPPSVAAITVEPDLIIHTSNKSDVVGWREHTKGRRNESTGKVDVSTVSSGVVQHQTTIAQSVINKAPHVVDGETSPIVQRRYFAHVPPRALNQPNTSLTWNGYTPTITPMAPELQRHFTMSNYGVPDTATSDVICVEEVVPSGGASDYGMSASLERPHVTTTTPIASTAHVQRPPRTYDPTYSLVDGHDYGAGGNNAMPPPEIPPVGSYYRLPVDSAETFTQPSRSRPPLDEDSEDLITIDEHMSSQGYFPSRVFIGSFNPALGRHESISPPRAYIRERF